MKIKGLTRILLHGEVMMLKDRVNCVFDQMRRECYNLKYKGIMVMPENFYPLSRREKKNLPNERISNNFYIHYKPLRN